MAIKTEKDSRYKVVRHLIEAKEIKTFKDIFTYIPKSVVSPELHTNNNRMGRMIDNPTEFTIGDIIKIAKLIEVDFAVIVGLIVKPGRSKIKKEN
jgi:hypothetical protein